MNHQPFEEWILAEDDLDPEQEQALQEHLKNCESCPQLAQSWQAVRQAIAAEPQMAPVTGFTHRWESHLIKKRVEQQRRLAWGIFGLFLALALIIVGIVYVPDIAQISPGGILAVFLYNLTVFFARVNQTRGIIELFSRSFTPVLPIAIWVLGASSLCTLCFLWIVVMWKIVVPKGVKS